MKDKKIILAIETSCDDTSVAILENEKVLACQSYNDKTKLNNFGGIVPEIVARYHERKIIETTIKALNQAKINLNMINEIAYTNEPGLIGSLFVGKIFAFTLKDLLNIECRPINHIHAHILSPFINQKPVFPFLSLIASGKTTSIFLVKSPTDIKELIKTVDDAVGETFDKIGKKLGYPYPGGPEIDKNFDISKACIDFSIKNNHNFFSFSGLKNKVFTYINKLEKNNDYIDKVAIGSSFNKCAIDTIIEKLNEFRLLYNCEYVCIGGGVACNSYFKAQIKKLFKNSFVPKKEYATDNAAMIGYLSYLICLYNN